MGRVLAALDPARNGLKLAILDACRNNPYTRSFRSGTRGLARIDAPSGTLIWYAAEPGKVAEDGPGRNGTFTGHLLQALEQPGLKVDEVFKWTAKSVVEATQGRQFPYPEGVTLVEFAFNEPAADGAAIPLAPTPVVPTGPVADRPGRSFRDCPECPEMVEIPGGEFWMGAKEGEKGGYSEEKPRHKVGVAGFAMGRYEVTTAEYVAFLNARRPDAELRQSWVQTKAEDSIGNHLVERGGSFAAERGYERYPVNHVSWTGAQAYAEWLSEKTGKAYRLPSEAEWEYAVRAGTTARYWWGDEDPVCRKGARNGAKFDDGRGCNGADTEAVGSYAANPWGLYDVHGNLHEWVEDCWNNGYRRAPGDGSAWRKGNCTKRVLRGGSWRNLGDDARSASRYVGDSGYRGDFFGFRLAQRRGASGR